MVRPKWEVSDALGLCEATLQSDPSLPQSVKKTARALLRCRTAALGGHALRCNHCGHQELSYNSCRNRHCPKCQYSKREQWALDRERDVLPVKYHHVVFTLPAELHVLAKAHPRIVYHHLFSSAWKTIKTLAADPRWIGGQAGMVAILHTWGD